MSSRTDFSCIFLHDYLHAHHMSQLGCLQGPAWGGVALGASPPGPGTDAALQEGMPRLTDIQAEQERLRESCSRSFGAAGSSPAGDGFASLLHW